MRLQQRMPLRGLEIFGHHLRAHLAGGDFGYPAEFGLGRVAIAGAAVTTRDHAMSQPLRSGTLAVGSDETIALTRIPWKFSSRLISGLES